MIKTSFLVLFVILIGLGVGTQAVFAASMTIDSDVMMTVGDDSIITIDTDDSNILDNKGTLNIDPDGTINVGSNSFTLLSNEGAINGPGVINLFGQVIEIENTGTITAVINEIFTDGVAIGGEIISIESTAVLLAGAQTISSWLIPVIVSAAGIGLVLLRKKEVIN